ncbi:MAG: phosphatase PAP2 family protein [Thermoanaerobaculia bacterium]
MIPPGPRRMAALLALALGCAAPRALAAEPEPSLFPAGEETAAALPAWVAGISADGKTILTAPVRWDASTWKRVAVGAGVVAALLLIDDEVRSALVSDRSSYDAAAIVGPLGQEYSWAVVAGFYGAGRAFGNDRATTVAHDGLLASLIAAGIITPAIQAVVGRARPDVDGTGLSFFDGGSSFPSGHTTQAFALASVIATHYESLWIDILAYALAAGVGWSRLENDAHFLSDVAAGALIGVSVGRAVVRVREEHRVSFEPFVTPGGVGINVRVRVGDVRDLWRER